MCMCPTVVERHHNKLVKEGKHSEAVLLLTINAGGPDSRKIESNMKEQCLADTAMHKQDFVHGLPTCPQLEHDENPAIAES